MDEFDRIRRTELKLILEGLESVRERMRLDTSVDLAGDEYNILLRLQDRLTLTLTLALESRFY